jgi:hypothetical protein
MRSIVRRDTGESYEEFLRGLAKASGMETPTREDLASPGLRGMVVCIKAMCLPPLAHLLSE